MTEEILRSLPSIDQLLRQEALQAAIERSGRDLVRDRLRDTLSELREEIRQSNGQAPAWTTEPETIVAEIARRLDRRLHARRQSRTQPLINATGVVLHTNLGRAPLSLAAIESIREVASGYCNLEYELETGKRGKRGAGLGVMFGDLLGAEAVAVANNCAAAVLLTLNTLAEGGEVIISRGELIEIGGSFRIPEVIAKSGARLREVGTTNRTKLRDYEQAINEQTKVILRAHPSNYRIVGFTEKPELADLAALARSCGIPFFEDLGSGSLIDLDRLGIRDEPTVRQSLEAGVSVVAFSGDKLLGGPQCGIVLGEADLIKRIKSNPLMRALRVDKLTYAALEATIESYLRGQAREEIPAIAALHATREEIARRAESFAGRASELSLESRLELIAGFSVVGGGSAPEAQLPTMLIAVIHPRLSADEIEEKLRRHSPPIVSRIVEDRLTLDLRTVQPAQEATILDALRLL